MLTQGASGTANVRTRIWAPLYLTLGYLAAGLLWVFASDHILLWMASSELAYQNLQTYKGWTFIFISGVALFVVTKRYFGTTMRAMQGQVALASQVARDQSVREAVFEQLDEGLCICDADGFEVLTNAAARRICHVSEPQTVSQALSDFSFFRTDGVSALPSEQLPMARARRGEVVELDQVYVHGGSLPEGKWLMISARPLFTDIGSAPFVVIVMRDVTQLKQAEHSLQQTEHSLSLLLANLPGMAFRSTPMEEAGFSFASAGCRDLTGCDPESFMSGQHDYRSMIVPVDQASVFEAIEKACTNGHSYMTSYRLRTAQGVQKWIVEQGMPLYDQEGRCIAIEGFAGDVTAQHVAESRLQERETYYRALVENLEDIIVEVGADGEIRFASPAVQRVLGYAPDAIVGKTIADYIHPEDVTAALTQVDHIVRRAHTNRSIELRIRAAQGDWRIIEGRGRAVHDSQRKGKLIFNARDITERRKAEEEKRLLAQALEQTAEALAFIDSEGCVRYVNKSFAQLFDCRREDCGEKHLRQVIPLAFDDLNSPPAGATTSFWEAFDSGAVWSGRGTYRPEHRSTVEAELHLSPIRDANGAGKGWLLLITDVSDRVRLEDQVRRMQRIEALGTLAGGIAHDFNNILAAILGYTELAADSIEDNHNSRAMLQEVLKAGHRARALVHQILTFSRQHEQERAPLQLHLIAREAIHLLRATLPASVHLEERIDKRCRPVLADATQIHQVLMNLCTNAYQALPESGGRISVALEEIDVDVEMARSNVDLTEGVYARMSVRDTGSGMNETTRARVFEPFFTTKEKGTGLGLSTVHGIVKSHDGTLTVYSEPGRGTVFNIYLPIAQGSELAKSSADLDVPAGQGEHILLVDDEEPLARVGEGLLRRLGYRVTACTSSADALRRFSAAADDFDLLLSDMQMPGMTGIVLSRKLRQMRPGLPVIISTGFSEVLTQQRIEQLGLSAVILKPIITRDLAMALRQALDKASAAGN